LLEDQSQKGRFLSKLCPAQQFTDRSGSRPVPKPCTKNLAPTNSPGWFVAVGERFRSIYGVTVEVDSAGSTGGTFPQTPHIDNSLDMRQYWVTSAVRRGCASASPRAFRIMSACGGYYHFRCSQPALRWLRRWAFRNTASCSPARFCLQPLPVGLPSRLGVNWRHETD